jgi:hypothetical protein
LSVGVALVGQCWRDGFGQFEPAIQSNFHNRYRRFLKVRVVNSRDFGLLRLSAAFSPQGLAVESGRALPQSKTLARNPVNPRCLYGHSIFENALTANHANGF